PRPMDHQSMPHPATNAFPQAVTSTTLTDLSRSAESSAASSSSRNASVMVLNSAGRHSTSRRTAPSSSTRMASPIRIPSHPVTDLYGGDPDLPLDPPAAGGVRLTLDRPRPDAGRPAGPGPPGPVWVAGARDPAPPRAP